MPDRASRRTAVPIPKHEERRCDLEGELTAELYSGQYVLLIDDTRVVEHLAYHFKVGQGDKFQRSWGRVRLSVELIDE